MSRIRKLQVWLLMLSLGTGALGGCASMEQFGQDLAKGIEAANVAAPTRVCPQCGQRFERQAFALNCPSDGALLTELGGGTTALRATAERIQPPQASVPPKPVERHVTFVLVHGTTHSNFLGGVRLGGPADWIDPDKRGDFADALTSEFKARDPAARVEVIPFRWDGDNSNPARDTAAKKLARRLDGLPARTEVHVIGHSHGGNVALRALTYSKRDAETVTLLGTPYLGVNMTRARAGDSYRLPLYLPLPAEAPKTALLNLYSPEDSVTTVWADICPGTTFDDLDATNAETWRRAFGLEKSAAPLLLTKKQKPKRREAGLRPNTGMRPDVAIYDFEGGDGVIEHDIPPELGLRVANMSIPANTLLDIPRDWVHSALHSAQVGSALGRAFGSRSFDSLANEIGVLTKQN